MPMLKVYFTAALLLLLVACSPFATFEDMGNKEDKFNEASFKALGARANISWNIVNGDLTTITVVYSAGTLNDIAFQQIESKVKSLVKSIYGEESYSIILAINLSE